MRPTNPRKIKSLDLRVPNRSAFDAIIVWKGKGENNVVLKTVLYMFALV